MKTESVEIIFYARLPRFLLKTNRLNSVYLPHAVYKGISMCAKLKLIYQCA